MLTLYLLFTFGISVFNAISTGYGWNESKIVGGFPRLMAWAGATMSAVGFTWCYLVLIAICGGPEGTGKFTAAQVKMMVDLGYLAIIFPCIGSGLAIMLDSWTWFWRRKTFGRGALAGYNTFAELNNIYSAFQYAPSAWRSASKLFAKDDSDGKNKLAVWAVVLSVGAGILTTSVIVRMVSKARATSTRLALASREGGDP
jgi:hypothetical protein